MIGEVIGNYRILERVGRGGMGTVYRATDETLHRDVAIKVLNAELQEPEVAKRFRAEAITVARLNHPGIAIVYEMFEHDGRWLMVMEFVRGETVEALLDRAGPLTPERAAEICLPALAALAHAHSLGVVHRDLKPANLMIAENGAVKVMDFGIARVNGAEHLTSDGYMMGTPAYMAPEQVLGQEIDARSDLYAMGVVLYRLVTGTVPFTGETPFAVAQSQVNDVPTPVRTLRVDVPPWVDQIVARALAKHPQDRFQSAEEFHDAIAPYAAPAGAIRPAGDTTRTALAPGRPGPTSAAGGLPAPGTAPIALPSPARSGILALTAALVVLTIIAGLVWRARTPAATSPVPAPAGGTTPVASPAASPAVPAATPTPVPSSSGTDGRRSGAPAAPATPVPGTPAPRVAAGEPLVFNSVKLLTVTGRKARDQDVLVSLGADRISVTPKIGGEPLQSMLYARVQRATYVRAKSPRFDPAFPAAPADLDMPGLFASAHHWLALQAKDTFLILRMEDSNYAKILDAVQARAHVKIAKPG